MKRIFALILTLAMALSLAAVPAFAYDAELGDDAPSASKSVIASYREPSGTLPTVYAVTITWGALDFDYVPDVWDPETHSYDGYWSAAGNYVEITNHSNTAIETELSFTAGEGFDGITGAFSMDNSFSSDNASLKLTDNRYFLTLPTAEGTAVNWAPHAKVRMELKGVLAKGTSNAKIGTITVALKGGN